MVKRNMVINAEQPGLLKKSFLATKHTKKAQSSQR
jgi:hypothetical protein